ncbi:MAG: hypothetical protein EGQ16_03450 [Clostridiales bacterium]|nr:hypothetical protein [Clostridiales bacterium]MBD9158879.1 hypothetical protein [Clostridiales bacterium]
MTTRKILAMIIALVMSVSLCACTEDTADRGSTSAKSDDTEITSKSDNMDVILDDTSRDGRTNCYKYSTENYDYRYYITTSSEGTYFFFSTKYEKAYVEFLERFDKDKYEIIDISVQGPTFESDAVFMITYTKKPNEAQQN